MMTDIFAAQYPLSAALNLPVVHAGPGFDELEVEKRLGPDRFANLMSSIKRVFSCGHAKYDDSFPVPQKDADGNPLPVTTHRLAGYERHCIFAGDLEAFLAKEGK